MLNLERFTKPNLQTVEVVVANNGTAQIMPDQFRHRGNRWVKRIILSCEDLSTVVPAPAINTNWLSNINGRWWRRMQEEASGVLCPVPNFDNANWERTAYQALGAAPIQWSWLWNFDHTFVIPQDDTMFLDVCNRALMVGSNPTPAGFLNVAVHGHGAVTGKPRMLQNPVGWPLSLNPVMRFANTAATTQNAVNQFGEDIIAEKLVCWSNSTLGGAAANDARLWSIIALRVYFEPRAHFGLCAPDVDNFVPVLAYGSHRNTDGRVAIWEPQGDPLILTDSEAIGWEFFNNGSGQPERVQVSIVSLLEE